MDHAGFFRGQLTNSADTLAWAVQQIPTGRWFVAPLPAFGEMSVAQMVFHVAWSDRHILIPQLNQWLDADQPPLQRADIPDEPAAWRETVSHANMETLLADFRDGRDTMLSTLEAYPAQAWDTTHPTLWGEVTLRWMLTRVYQHTVEHTDTLLKMGLFWDYYLEQFKQQRLAERDKNAEEGE